ncbi:MAG: helix-turn-helix domain-containing protein [Acidimicrobiia bacterium]|nr:helix-turn-helix domain-containing protein [Acidimicrobiia bacterium]
MTSSQRNLVKAIEPLIDAIGASIVSTDELEEGDITLDWNGKPVIGVRLDEIISLDRLIAAVEQQLGSPLRDLDRTDKQRAVRMLDERGAFQLRRSIEDVGEAMGVSRITIYNYLSAIKDRA